MTQLKTPASKALPKEVSWQDSLSDLIVDPHELLKILGLQPELVGMSGLASKQFSCRVPREFVKKMRHGDPSDPLLLQVLPQALEVLASPGYTEDPVGELKVNPIPGLLHKYQGRVLLTLTGSCAINCRYCFRRHFPYQDNNPGQSGWKKAIDYVKKDSSISEIIYSGGEPLLLKDNLLEQLSNAFSTIDHVKTLRIHTRLPVVIPQRIDDGFCRWISDLPLRKVMVIHSNHPNEIDPQLKESLKKLAACGVTLLNQSVLLKDVNDNENVLRVLSERLFDCGVIPYYLHVLDKVKGVAHFDIAENDALRIYHQLQGILPGYLVPKLVREVAGVASKVQLCS